MAAFASIIPYVVFVPVSIYGNIRLWKQRNELFVQKRNIFVAFGLNCALIFQQIAAFLTHLSILSGSYIFIIIAFCIFFFSFWALLFFLNTKNWLIYFHQK